MLIERFYLTEDQRVHLTAYIQEFSPEMQNWEKRPAVLVCPGGGYMATSDREAEPIALSFAAKGFHAFVLRYSVKEHAKFPNPLVEASKAMKIIRENAGKWHIDPDRIAVCGFSAGGHLAASLGTLWNDPEIMSLSGVQHGENRPNALILCYPVIHCDLEGFGWMWKMVIGDRDAEGMRKKLSCELNVGSHTPPTFLFHTYMDNLVPVEHSLLFANALAQNDIPFEAHIFQMGVHGLSLSNELTSNGQKELEDPEAARWMELCTAWLWRLFKGGPQGSRAKLGGTVSASK